MVLPMSSIIQTVGQYGEKVGKTAGRENGIRSITLAMFTCGGLGDGIANGKKVIIGTLSGMTIERGSGR